MKRPLISIIVPAYNAEKYVGKCLSKILSQTYENFEVIVIDDGSADGTVNICNKFASKDSRVRLMQVEHGGVSKARNCGLENASGEFVTFFDADDFPESNILEEYVNAYNDWGKNVSLVLTGMYWDNYCDKLVPQEKHLLEKNRGFKAGERYMLQTHDVAMLSWTKLFNFITNKCYSMEVIKNANIRFKEDVHIAEDMLFNLDYLEASEGFIGVINKPLYHYVKHGSSSLSASYYDGAIEHVCQSFDKLLEFERRQPGVSKDDEYVIESMYLMDWVSRLSMLTEDNKLALSKMEKFKICNNELKNPKFRKILDDSRKGKKIGALRYVILKRHRFELFCLVRRIYHIIRREKAE